MHTLKSLIGTKTGRFKPLVLLCALCLALIGGQAFAIDNGYEQSNEQGQYETESQDQEKGGYYNEQEEESYGEEYEEEGSYGDEEYSEDKSYESGDAYGEPENEEQGW